MQAGRAGLVQAQQATVAVLNSSPELIALMAQVLGDEGFETVTARVPDIQHGREDFLALMTEHAPDVVIYDVSPPYEENFNFLCLLMDTEVASASRFLVTSTDRTTVVDLAGPDFKPPIIGKPFDLEDVIASVRQVLSPRP